MQNLRNSAHSGADRVFAYGSGFDYLFVALNAWAVGGAYLDGWAHTHIALLETFFTPWHAVLYSGIAAQAAFLCLTAWLQHRHGTLWRHSLPPGYLASLLGSLLFLIGGIADLVWHTLFGIEADVDALLSPTHLILAFASVLIATGPVRSTIARGPTAARSSPWPALLALTLVLCILTFFTQYSHPWVQQLATQHYRTADQDLIFYRQALGISSILLQSAVLVGIVLYALDRLSLPVGALTVLLLLNALGMGLMRDHLEMLPGAIVAGIAGDLLVRQTRSLPAPNRRRILAFALPVAIYTVYFATLQFREGVWWSVHLWAGSILLASMAGFLLTFLVTGPINGPEGHR